jgi:hypothetical protein
MAMGISGLTADKNMNPITDPNPVDIVEDYKNLPDNVLIGYAKDRENPNATYALTVLMSRKRAKDELAKGDLPTTTVADDVIADISGAPQSTQGMGGASMFVPQDRQKEYLAQQLMQQAGPQGAAPMNMEGINTPPMTRQEASNTMGLTQIPSNIGKNYAGGGIVAFAGDQGSYVNNFGLNNLAGINEEALAEYLQAKEEFPKKDYVVKSPVETVGIQNLVDEKKLREEANKLGDSIYGGDMIDYKPDGIRSESEIKDEITKMLKEEEALKNPFKDYDDGRSTDELAKDIMDLESTDTSISGDNTLPSDARGTRGVRGLTDRFDKLRSRYQAEDKSLEEIGKEVQAGYKQFGVDQNVFGDLAADIEKDRQQLGKSRGEAADLALIEAGLLIAGGTSPNALSNLKEAAPAVRNYGVQLQNLRGEDRALKSMELQLRGAEQAGKMGMADKAMALQDNARKRLLDIDKAELDAEQRFQIAELQADAALQAAMIQAKNKEQYILLEQAKKDPNFYNIVDVNGKPMRQFNTEKFMELVKPYGVSSQNTLIANLAKQYQDTVNSYTADAESFKKRFPNEADYIQYMLNIAQQNRGGVQSGGTPTPSGKVIDFNSIGM